MAEHTHGVQDHTFVRIHPGPMSLSRVLERIHNPDENMLRFMVHVFLEVVPEVSIPAVGRSYNQLLSALDNTSFSCQQLRSVSVDGVYFNDCPRRLFSGKNDELKRRMGTIVNQCVPSSLAGADSFVEESLLSIARGTVAPVYAMNFPWIKSASKSYLREAPQHIVDQIGASPGINIPSFYLSGQNSFLEMRVEDGYPDRCDLLHWGSNKIWTFINPRYSWKFCCLMHDVVENLRAAGEDCSAWDVGCKTPVNHQNIALTPSFLARNGIKHETMVQPPPESSVRARLRTLPGSEHWHQFECSGCAISKILGDPRYYTTVRLYTPDIHPGPEAKCPHNGAAQQELARNGQQHACSLCSSSFSIAADLTQHLRDVHGEDGIGIASQPVTCEWCHKTVSRRGMGSHKRFCKERPDPLA